MMTELNKKINIEEIKAQLKVVCICKGIKQGKILQAIKNYNCNNVDAVNAKTGSGSGGCKGTRCKPVIEDLLIKNKIKQDL